MFACLLVAQYDTYNVAYTYFGDITAKKTGKQKCSMFACLLVAQYDTYNVAYTYFGDITAKKTGIASQV